MPVRPPATHLIGAPALRVAGDVLTGASGGTVAHVYAATGEPTVEVPLAGPAEIDQGVRAARAALAPWQGLGPHGRRDALLRLADLIAAHAGELAGLQTLEIGLPAQLARQMPAIAADYLRYNAGWADKIGGEVVATWPVPSLDYTLDEPYGVVAGIIPWNGTLIAAAQLLGPALAAGNTVVVKPSELAPFVAPAPTA